MGESWKMEGGGTLTLEEEGIRVRLWAVRPDDGRGLYKVWVRGLSLIHIWGDEARANALDLMGTGSARGEDGGGGGFDEMCIRDRRGGQQREGHRCVRLLYLRRLLR